MASNRAIEEESNEARSAVVWVIIAQRFILPTRLGIGGATWPSWAACWQRRCAAGWLRRATSYNPEGAVQGQLVKRDETRLPEPSPRAPVVLPCAVHSGSPERLPRGCVPRPPPERSRCCCSRAGWVEARRRCRKEG